jgi:hypothetical protein
MTRRVVLLLAALAAANCTASVRSVDAIAEGYVRAALQLAQHDPSLVDDWRGPESFRPGPRIPVAEVAREIETLQRDAEYAASDISSAQELARVHYLSAQLRALQFAAHRQLGRAASIDDQAREEFGVAFPRLDVAAVQRTHQALRDALPGAGALSERMRDYRERTMIPARRRQQFLTEALQSCRSATAAVLPLPRDESIAMVLGDPPVFDAFARYRGNNRSELEISGGPLDIARAHRIACHEGYPGHHVQHLLIEQLYRERQWPELLLMPAFGPHLLYLEGAAEAGADLVLSESRVDRLLQDLQPIVTDVARAYLDGSLTEERALERLANEALVTNPAGTLAFIEQRRARALVYVEGRRLVYERLKTKDLAGLYDAFRSIAALQ